MAEFVMPILGADMTAGTLVAWRKSPGDAVRRGDIIAEVESDKADVEIEIFMNGVLEKILVEPGEKVPVGTPLATIRLDPGEVEPAPSPAAVGPAAPAAMPAVAPTPMPRARTGAPAEGCPPEGRAPISPTARQLAAELRVDLATVAGTGPDGRIQRRDVLAAAEAQRAAAPETAPRDKQTRMRQAIAAAMMRSARDIPHFHLASTIDMGAATAWLAEENARRKIADRLLSGVLLIKATALALREVPELNASWIDERVVLHEAVHTGIAISLPGGGLVAPALHDADRRSLGDLMTNLRDLVMRARAGSLRSSEISDPTMTITSLGEEGAEAVFGLIYPPQVALAGFGRLHERPMSIGGQVVSRPVVVATLAADHRVADGHRGSRFLAAVERLLQAPEKL
jgi:pyruvate dehydrogenase E2 component (dihydrolipoamide acetyltransferase)